MLSPFKYAWLLVVINRLRESIMKRLSPLQQNHQLGHAATEDWEIHQVDVKSAYLYAPLKEKVYMKPLPGILRLGDEGKVIHVVKCLYGLKQAGRGWYKEMSQVFMNELGFKQPALDHSIFYQHFGDECTVVAVATDDIVLTLNSHTHINKLKSGLCQYWDISDLGELHWYLGFEVQCDRAAWTISINQATYIDQMVAKFRLTNAKPVTMPMEPGAWYTKKQCPSSLWQITQMQNVPYAEVIGSVLWPVVISWLDCSYATLILSQFIQNPAKVHWEALKHVIIYLRSTKHYWLTFGRHTKPLATGYCDSDWASQAHHHLILGYSFHLVQGAVTWSSKKQYIIALLSTEAEYIMQTHTVKEALWLCSFFGRTPKYWAYNDGD